MDYDVIHWHGIYKCEVEGRLMVRPSYTLGDLLSLCDKYPDRLFRFLGTPASVGDLHSWRGSYDIAAIEPTGEKKTGQEIGTTLTQQLTKVHHGWKGGEYRYDESDVFYVAHKGSSEEYQVVGYELTDTDVVLITKIVPY